MKRFGVTFQQRYQYDTHPILPEVTHRSYLVIEAEDEAQARAQLFAWLGSDWCMIYPYDADFERQIREYDLVPVVVVPH